MHLFANAITQARSHTSILQILLLEDDPIDRELIEAMLRNGGIKSNSICVSDRKSFLESLNARPPDLILADYVLPKFDGIAALELANAICPDVPFILVSGVLGEEQAIDALKKGATDYVLKQRLDRLVPAVQRALRESQERQEREKIAKALQKTDNLLRAVVDASPVGIITLSRDQRIITWNTTAEQLYGWKAQAVVDSPLSVIIPKGKQDDFNDCFARSLQAQRILNQELQHVKQDGSSIDVSLSLSPLHDADDNVYGVVMTVVDITAQKQVEAQRLRLLEQERTARATAETTNRIKDEFLGVLSHELRTPLNAIVGWIKLIQKGKLTCTMLKRAFDAIERNAAAQTQLVEDLLDISRIIRGQVSLHIQPTDVTTLIRNTVESLRPAAEAKSLQLELNVAPSIDRILADSNRLQQVFRNLISNAIKFTQPLGRITVACQAVDSYLKIQVSDSGIGIAPEFIPHIFEYFRQADGSITRSQSGLGLGLAITRHLVELHGGTIEVSSDGLGQGTTFTLLLPMRVIEADTQFNETQIQTGMELQGIKAIVVDDDRDLRELITSVLEQQGVEVQGAASAQDALSILNFFHPDILIGDIGQN